MASEEGAEQSYVPQKKKSESEDDKRRKKIVPGSLMKALMRPGGGESNPSDGDQIIYHCTVRTLDGVVVESTRSEHGGKGIPIRNVLGKSKMILGLLEGIPTMLKGEVAMFKMMPQMHYGEEDCPVPAPSSFPKEDDLHFEIELIDFSKAKARIAKVVSDDLGVLKKVPKGLEMGIGTMTRNEKAVVYVTNQYLTPSPLLPMIEGYEEVHFEVELVHFIQVRDMLGDGRLIKRRLRDGKGDFPMDCPLHDSLLRVHYKGMLLNEEKTVFYDTRVDNQGEPLEFSSGEGMVPEGFEMCVRLMLPGEIALCLASNWIRPPSVPEGAHVQWEIELLGFEMPKDWTGLNFQEIMDEAEKIRVTGNRLFKEGKFELAKAKYEKVLREFNHVNPQTDEEGKVFLDTRLRASSKWENAESPLTHVLDATPVHAKALYRRGMAYMAAGDFEEARSDFQMMIKVDKSSEPDATAALAKLKKQEQEVERKARKQFKGLFDKKPGEIAEVQVEDRAGGEITGENQKNDLSAPLLERDDSQHCNEADGGQYRMGWFYSLWPSGRRIFSALGLDRCTIL
ncbi:peptidyl-prolyl cis-trans isomerase PASTICCINO1 [Gossypium australe]|uniref:peptidylprolyl isomerase n=1 Tax=Gossypium australe TaxID=47621 RepID=A0A5B6UAG8_9ROSI|nr:peptidyl-prolyl cis-trans isomerase PASTICCINO1 [Gossypium australe]